MGCGIIITDIYISGASKDRLESKVEDLEELVIVVRNELIALAASNSYPVFYEDGTPREWSDYVSMKTKELMDSLVDYEYDLRMYRYALENIDDIIDDC
jgi:hypothetical protein